MEACVARWGQKMHENPSLALPVLLGVLLAACGTTPAASTDNDVLYFQPQDINIDVPTQHPDAQTDAVLPDILTDVPDVPAEVAIDVSETIDIVPDVPDVPDVAEVYVPECVTDTTCADSDVCTVDLCANDKCLHTPVPGCCHNPADCAPPGTCKAATCVNNQCGSAPVANCCASGVCCDTVKQSTKVAQSPCTDAAIAFEFSCQGADIWGRRAELGCDGKQTSACSGNIANYSWTQWLPVASCPNGSLCQTTIDKSQFPACSGAPAPTPGCISDIGCEDGNPCTTDTCTAGSCTHGLADTATLCGNTALYTEYGCLNGPAGDLAGGSQITRVQYASCGAQGKCDGAPGFTPWTVTQDCQATEKCDVPISTEPGTCTLISVCKPGAQCCGADGQWAPTGTACGSATVASQYQCTSAAKGSAYSKRDGVNGCSGTSAQCSAVTPSWGNWTAAGSCAFNELCSVPVNNAPPVCTAVCAPGAACCTNAGDWADQGTKCADALLKSVSKCSSANGVETVLSSQLFPGCTGLDGTCSTDTANLSQSAYTIVKTCQSYEKCVATGDTADCILNAPCEPGTQCCTASGQFAPLGAQCASANKTQYSCSNNMAGGAVLTRDVSYGCSGGSIQCTYDPANYYYSPWVDTQDCQSTEACTSPDLTSAVCTSLQVCVPGSICCDGSGNFMPKGTKCGTQGVLKTLYECDTTALGGSILKQEYYASCVGTAANCSNAAADLVWDPPVWLTKQACGPQNYCHVTGPTDPGLCNQTPP